MDRSWWNDISEAVLGGKKLDAEDAVRIASFDGPDTAELFALANRVRWQYKGGKVALCAIVNARSGKCSEDCVFCAQSAHYDTGAPEYEMVSVDRIRDSARRAKDAGAVRFSIVTSGLGVDSRYDLDAVVGSIRAIRNEGLTACASVGVLDSSAFEELKAAGLSRYHHNLETAPSFFDKVCTTHSYDDDVETIKRAASLGLDTCCGGIFGMGESWEQRVEFLYFLAGLNPDSVPLNFLVPIAGTPLEGHSDLTPVDCLKIIALARLILPEADIVLCGGREVNLRDMQGTALMAGVTGLMAGDYLTTPGREPELDLKMIQDAGLQVEGNSQ